MHEHHPDIGKLTWKRKPEAIWLAEKEYQKNPEANLGMYASTMYSFRSHGEAIQKLLTIRFKIADRLRLVLKHPGEPNITVWANGVDTFSTHLEFLSRWRELSGNERSEFEQLAEEAVLLGIPLAKKEEKTGHNLPLLQLTYATILINRGRRAQPFELLRQAYDRAPYVKDMNQRSRIYRKVAKLAHQAHAYRLALAAGASWLHMHT